ncbi:chromosome partitioning protein, partial [Methylobacterium sp. PvP109]
MPVITFSSPKGGAGKTTAACILASMLAEQGATVTIIDADPNQFVQEWAQLPGLPATLQVVGGATEETIMDKIEEAASMTAFVIVDLEGLASLMVSHAISMSDLVVIPVQGSQFDASQAARQIGLIKRTEKRGGRAIPYTVLITRTNPAIMPHTLKH